MVGEKHFTDTRFESGAIDRWVERQLGSTRAEQARFFDALDARGGADERSLLLPPEAGGNSAGSPSLRGG